MRLGLIEVHCIHFEKPDELILLENQEVILAFATHATQKAFTDRICSCSWNDLRSK